MTSSSPRRRHLASSPFAPEPERVILQFEVDELVNHDSHGMGRVVSLDAAGVTVDFRPEIIRIPSPFPHLSKL
ncbi:MAG: hypothetical protein ACXVDH_02540 [Nocardioides sp.]|uniref:hypothetical protein n=1 Tax=Nocardioides nematodiphilus TaxID=2849669 RepID=UPI001CD92C99|nr:hypothetical protein [Nocardioides nematodiphilus]MCA1982225.1 hypothetical protein [Nocardioides nematodiphilus]